MIPLWRPTSNRTFRSCSKDSVISKMQIRQEVYRSKTSQRGATQEAIRTFRACCVLSVSQTRTRASRRPAPPRTPSSACLRVDSKLLRTAWISVWCHACIRDSNRMLQRLGTRVRWRPGLRRGPTVKWTPEPSWRSWAGSVGPSHAVACTRQTLISPSLDRRATKIKSWRVLRKLTEPTGR